MDPHEIGTNGPRGAHWYPARNAMVVLAIGLLKAKLAALFRLAVGFGAA
jgi:hypothetical protein